jgi:hypothetical protein
MHQARLFRRKNPFQKMGQKSNYNIKFDLIAPGTPQQNNKVDSSLAKLYGKILLKPNSA